MVSEIQAVRVSRTVSAAPEQAYKAFTTDVGFREWLSDSAYVQNRDGGKLFLCWTTGYTTTGQFTAREPNQRVEFSWQGLGEPGTTHVTVDLQPEGDGTRIVVTHEGLGSGEGWARTVEEVQKGWEIGLENLQSVLETGQDLRIVRRPMLGILVDAFDEAAAARLGLERPEGILIADAISGLGAEAAGLRQGDVILKLGGVDTREFNGLVLALEGKHAGDTVDLEVWRDRQRIALPMTLSGRPIPDVPPTAAGLADAVQNINAELAAELNAILDGVGEEEASRKPSPDEWSAKEVLVHLILGERDTQYYIGTLLGDDEPLAGPSNSAARTKAFLSVHPTLAEVRTELDRAQAETVAFIRELPESLVARTSTYVRFGQGMMTSALHPQLHFDQIRAVLGQ